MVLRHSFVSPCTCLIGSCSSFASGFSKSLTVVTALLTPGQLLVDASAAMLASMSQLIVDARACQLLVDVGVTACNSSYHVLEPLNLMLNSRAAVVVTVPLRRTKGRLKIMLPRSPWPSIRRLKGVRALAMTEISKRVITKRQSL